MSFEELEWAFNVRRERDAAIARAEAAETRVRELEAVLGAWGDAELALREEKRRFVNDEQSDVRGAIERKRPFRDAALTLAVDIATKRREGK